MQIMFAMLMLSMMFMVPRAAAAATRINEVLDTVPDIRDPDLCVGRANNVGTSSFRM